MILVVNAGSSSLKLALFTESLRQTLATAVTEIGAAARLAHAGHSSPVHAPTQAAALQALLIAAIHGLAVLAPTLPQTASFDTAFHATNPPEVTRYALPDIPPPRACADDYAICNDRLQRPFAQRFTTKAILQESARSDI